jgi:hypothetical protein
MLGFMEVLGGVLILGRIAAAHLAAYQAQSQMHPGVAYLQAFLASAFVGVFEFDLIEMFAGSSHI